jgi:uncharacterized protein involved in exopolysaccharide biosynthesis
MAMSRENDQSVLSLLQDLGEVARRRRGLILAAYAGIVLSTILAIFLIPPTYRATGKVLLTTDRADVSTDAERGIELVRTSQVSEGELSSQLQILRSRELMDTVLADLGLASPEVTKEEPSGVTRFLLAPVAAARAFYRRHHGLDKQVGDDPLYWKARWMLERLDTENAHPSNVIEVSFTSRDPQWSQKVVNTVMQRYVELHASIQQISAAQEFFSQQSSLLRDKLAESEKALKDARDEAGTLAGQQEEIHTRLNEFSADLARARIAREEQQQRVAYLERTLGKADRLGTPELLALEAKRAKMAGDYQPDSERMQALDAQIARLRKALAGYQMVTGSGTESAPGNATDLVAARAALAAADGKEKALATAVDEYRRQADFLDSKGFDLARLERQVKLDEETYLSYVRSAEQSRLSNAMEQNKVLQLRIIEPAPLPLEPAAPKRVQMMLFALLGGLALSIGVGMARDQLDRTVRNSADVRRAAGLDTLAVVHQQS